MITLTILDKEYEFYARIIRFSKEIKDEEEWIEFKQSNGDPDLIGKYLSALGNVAALSGKDAGYLVWGIDNATHDIVGTSFNPSTAKKGGESLENYLSHMLSKNAFFQFYSLEVDGKPLVVCRSNKAVQHPISFAGVEYIRVGASLKKLAEFPERERKLWLGFSVFAFECDSAKDDVAQSEIGKYLDLSAYYRLIQKPYPSKMEDILTDLKRDRIIKEQDDGRYRIQNLGALSIGRNFEDFASLTSKGIRVIVHGGDLLTSYLAEKEFRTGYAICFNEIVDYIDMNAGRKEEFGEALRKTTHAYPIVAIREMIGNAIIHQDLTISGAGIIIHVFASRVTVTNPGELLCDSKRTIDAIPKVRNENLARVLRKMGIVEEQGSGFDRIEDYCASALLPSVEIKTGETQTTIILYNRKGYREYSNGDFARTCYTFACLRHFNGLDTNNQVIRERFGISEKNAAIASRILKETVEKGYLKVAESSHDKRAINYVPFYA